MSNEELQQSLLLPKTLSSNRTELGTTNSNEIEVVLSGFISILLEELKERGYTIPNTLLQSNNMKELEEIEIIFYKSIIIKHLNLLALHLPILTNLNPSIPNSSGLTSRIEIETAGSTGTNTTVKAPHLNHSISYTSTRPSPLSSSFQANNITSTTTNPSALFLASILSILISLQSDSTPENEEEEEEEEEEEDDDDDVDRGVVKELRALKVKEELSEKFFGLVGGLLDSYLLEGKGEGRRSGVEEGRDTLVDLFYKDFPLHSNSNQRTVCALDLLLTLASYPQVREEVGLLISHAVVLGSSEYVWKNGLLSSTSARSNTWRNLLSNIDCLSTPRILHAQTYLLSTFYAILSVYLLISSHYSHFYSLNPLAPDSNYIGIPEAGKGKGWSLITFLIWWFYVFSTIGWMGEVIKVFRGGSKNKVGGGGGSSLIPLIAHILIFSSILCRFSLLLFSVDSGWRIILLPTSVSLLAWSIPFLAMSRMLPQNLTNFGNPCHFNLKEWTSHQIKNGSKKYRYSSPPKSIPESHRALKNLSDTLGGFNVFGKYFFVVGFLLLWSLAGELDYPGLFFNLFHSPSQLLSSLQFQNSIISTTSNTFTMTQQLAAPLEARSSLAFTFFLGILIAYFSGAGASSSSSSNSNSTISPKNLDKFSTYSPSVAFSSRLERLLISHHFTYLPSSSPLSTRDYEHHYQLRPFSTPPLPSPLNLFLPLIKLFSILFNLIIGALISIEERNATDGHESTSSGIRRFSRHLLERRGREFVWRIGLIPFFTGDGLRRVLRKVRNGGRRGR